jgi:hypothetical protein
MQGLLVCLAVLQEPPASPLMDPRAEAPPWLERLHGSTSVRYRARWVSNQSDADLFEYLSLSYGDPALDAITASASARFAEDLDGHQGADGYTAFDSLDDSYHHAATSRLYTAYVDFNGLPSLRLRGGRQVLDELPEALPLDGGSVRWEGEGLSASVFGGVPVNLFESSPRGDATYGGWLGLSPWSRSLLRLEYLHLKDENAFGLFDDDLVGVTAEQGVGAWLVHARHTLLEGESRQTTARLTGSFPDAGLVLDGQADVLYERQQALSYPLDPYSVFLIDLQPYVQYSARASKSIGTAFALDVSGTRRDLVKEEDGNAYNHEFTRWNVTARLDRWPWEDLSLAVPVDFWQSTGDDFWTAGADVAWHAHRSITIGAGTAYALYTLDAFTGEERDHVRCIYGMLRWKLQSGTVLDVRYVAEENDIDLFRTVEVGVRHAF